jgi:predicted ATPase
MGGESPKPGVTPMGAVFLSYASEDAEAAHRICEALRAAGVEVWFDQSELRGGDAWDAAIRKQIKACGLFIPIISANTDARAEGYFRLEWKLAVDRSHLMSSDRAFLLPVVIDNLTEPDARVPDRFRELQWTTVLEGKAPQELVDTVQRLLETPAAVRPGSPQPSQSGPSVAPNADDIVEQSMAAAPYTESPARMVGRLSELAALENRLKQAISGRPQLVFVSGEPGVGKTTLLDAFAERHATRGGLIYTMGRCAEHYGPSEAYLPLFDAITRLCRGAQGGRMLHLLRRHAPSWLAQLPALLGDAELETLRRRAVGGTRERMLRELADAITAISIDVPLILRLEDLHWSDASTLDWLGFIARCTEPARLLIVNSLRPAEGLGAEHPLVRLLAELGVAKHCGLLRLGGLAATEVAEYLAAQFGTEPQAGPKPTALAEAIYALTEGNPLFVVNVANDLVARGMLIERNGRWELTCRLEDIAATIPEDLRRLIELQLERLTRDEGEALEVASAAGEEFHDATVAAALGQQAETVETRCSELGRRQSLVRTVGSERWPDGTLASRFAFRHALYRATLYERLSATRRARLHVAIGDRLERGFGERARERAAELATHFERGGDIARAVRYHHAAGENASGRSAARLAIEHYRRALHLLADLPDSRERTQQEIALNIALGPLLMACEGFGAPAAEEVYRRAQELCDRIGATRELFTALWGLWLYRQGGGHLDDAKQIGQRLLEIAARVDDRSLLLQAHHSLWATSLFRGELLACFEHANAGAQLYRVAEHAGMAAWYGNHDAGACGLCFHAVALALHGDLAAAAAASQAAISLTEEIGHPFSQALTLFWAAMFEQIAREHKAARRHAERSLRLAVEHGFEGIRASALCITGWAAAVEGQHTFGAAGIRAALSAVQATGTRQLEAYLFAVLADACRIAGRTSEGLAAVHSGLETAHSTKERFYEAELLRLEWELVRATATEGERSVALLERAVELARRQAAHLLELRALTSLVHATQDPERTVELLPRVAALLEQLTLRPESADAREARRLVPGSRGDPAAIP